ncbi:MAG: hypothetical protein CMA88_04440 [Euryarchaeota archaeon]|nr:hypothetical protein [Euryarchaeota archaeon]|tara:strand:- start:164 stop:430 length:267 start_codon:yes stop_codon:yes gene_type:complete
MPPGNDEDIVDKVIGNPAFDQLFGYHIFFRRAAIPILLFIIGLFTYTVLDEYMSHQASLTVSFVAAGLSLGPVLNLERYFGVVMSRKK